jgi:hypothetical protein
MFIKTGPFGLSTYNIHSPDLSVLEQLKTLLNKLVLYSFETDFFFYIKYTSSILSLLNKCM